jgi:hypothetical protein
MKEATMKENIVLKKKMDAEMTALLVLNKTQSSDFRVLIKLREKHLIHKASDLLLKKRNKDVFDLFCSKGEVNGYYPAGTKLPQMPQLTLIEDML